MSDSDIRRFGRWKSDAYKLYITQDEGLMATWGSKITKAFPQFELN